MNIKGPVEPIGKLIRQFIFDLNTRDLGKLMVWLEEDAQAWIPPSLPIQGTRRISLLFKIIFRRYLEIKWEVKELYQASENIILVEILVTGTFASGKNYENNLISVVKFNDTGKIYSISDYFKNTAIFM